MNNDTEEFVQMMLKKSKQKEETQASIGLGLNPKKDKPTKPYVNTIEDEDIEKTKKITKKIMESLI